MSKTSTLTAADLELPDAELGALFFGLLVGEQAEKLGFSRRSIPKKIELQIIEEAKYVKARAGSLSAIAIAANKAAFGDFETAGRQIRDYVTTGAINATIGNLLISEIQKRLKWPSEGGKKTAQAIKKRNAPRDKAIRADAERLLAEGENPRAINSILANKFSLTARQIGRIRNRK